MGSDLFFSAGKNRSDPFLLMVRRLRIGIVGCGAIGSSLAKAIIKDFTNQAKLVSLYDIDKNKAIGLARKLKVKA